MGKEPTITIRGHKFDAYQVDAYWLGMEDERERIIKLLEAELNADTVAKDAILLMEPIVDMTTLWEVELKIATWMRAIELIKGETNE